MYSDHMPLTPPTHSIDIDLHKTKIDCPSCKSKKALSVTDYDALTMEEPDIYSTKYATSICDKCNKDVLLNGRATSFYHCYSGKHKKGYDICIGCALQIVQSK